MTDRIPQSVVDRLWREWRLMDEALPRPVSQPVPDDSLVCERRLKVKRVD